MKARLFAARPFYSVVSATITNDSLGAIRQVKLKYRGRVSTLHDYESRIATTITDWRRIISKVASSATSQRYTFARKCAKRHDSNPLVAS